MKDALCTRDGSRLDDAELPSTSNPRRACCGAADGTGNRAVSSPALYAVYGDAAAWGQLGLG
jgi:hypothetical protein